MSWLDRYRVELRNGLDELAVYPLACTCHTFVHILVDVVVHVPPKETAADLLESIVATQKSACTIMTYYVHACMAITFS